jgi:hypothetical protein
VEYRGHQFEIEMTTDWGKLEQFLDSLMDEVVRSSPMLPSAFSGSPMWVLSWLWRRWANLTERTPFSTEIRIADLRACHEPVSLAVEFR